MELNSKIYVAGHTGLVGSALVKSLKSKGYTNIIGKTSEEMDLRYPKAVETFFQLENPEYVILAAAKVGGIVANNTYRADFIHENLMIQNNVIHQSHLSGVKKLLFLGSTCIYPKDCPQPMKEEYLLTSPLEYTNEPYAIAKIAGIKMCESYNIQYGTNFISVMPTNLYGPNDNFDLEKSHVLPALIRKIHLGKCLEENNWEAICLDLNKRPIEDINGENTKEEMLNILSKYGINMLPSTTNHSQVSVEIWGSGKPMREFLWSEDMADACIFIMKKINFTDLICDKLEIRNTHINIGTGKEISIYSLAYLIKRIIYFKGGLKFNTNRPDGTIRKLTDSSKLSKLGWKYHIECDIGIESIYLWYLDNLGTIS
jgi:GDP-L-fucose synthase